MWSGPSRFRLASALVLTIAGGLLLATPASALTTSAEPEPSRPGPASADRASAGPAAVRPAPLVTEIRPRARSKRGLAAPPMSAAMLQANARKQAAARRLLRRLASRVGPDSKCTTAACRAGLPAARDLAATQQAQRTDYFCGPAMVSEMLAQVGVTLTQWAAAHELGTTPAGTDWSDSSGYPVPRVLNQDQARNQYVAVGLPWTPTVSQLKTYEIDLVTDINENGGAPLAGSAYEVPGGPHLVGNPVNQTIMHWIDIRGYQAYGAVTDYEDSVHNATSIGLAVNVPAYSSLASSTMVDILGARGYDW
jgi:hypothetical protein